MPGKAEAASVVVAVRVRPVKKTGIERGVREGVRFDGNTVYVLDKKGKVESTWSYDFAFDSAHTGSAEFVDQEKVYNDMGVNILDAAMGGFNCCLFAYGQSGAGKTYTLQGKVDEESQVGMIPRLLKDMHARISAEEEDPRIKFNVRLRFVEIYNEVVQDLFNRQSKIERVFMDKKKGVQLKGAVEFISKSYDETMRYYNDGLKSRVVGSTGLNDESSRSHSIFQIEVERVEQMPGKDNVRVSVLNLCDLAGSEDRSKTLAVGKAAEEGSYINKSLLALRNVIEALVKAQEQKQAHKKEKGQKSKTKAFIPYRDSALTRVLQSSLGGNSKTFLVAAISPSAANHDETVSTLRFAKVTSTITNVVKRDLGDAKDQRIKELESQTALLRTLLEAGPPPAPAVGLSEEEQREAAEARENFEEMKLQLEAMDLQLEDEQKSWTERFAAQEADMAEKLERLAAMEKAQAEQAQAIELQRSQLEAAEEKKRLLQQKNDEMRQLMEQSKEKLEMQQKAMEEELAKHMAAAEAARQQAEEMASKAAEAKSKAESALAGQSEAEKRAREAAARAKQEALDAAQRVHEAEDRAQRITQQHLDQIDHHIRSEAMLRQRAEALEHSQSFTIEQVRAGEKHNEGSVTELKGHDDDCSAVAWSTDGRFLATGSYDRSVRLWWTNHEDNANPWTEMMKLVPEGSGHRGMVNDLAFSPLSVLLATATADSKVVLWSTKFEAEDFGTEIMTLKGHNELRGVSCVRFSVDGEVLATSSFDWTIMLWSVCGDDIGTCIATLSEHKLPVSMLSFSPDGGLMASCSDDKRVMIWYVARGECDNYVEHVTQTLSGRHSRGALTFGKLIKSFKAHSAETTAVAFSPTGDFLATGSAKSIKIWHMKGDAVGSIYKTLTGFKGGIRTISFSPDGAVLAAGSSYSVEVGLWSITGPTMGKKLRTLRGHTDYISDVKFSPDGSLLASGSWDDTCRVWPITGRVIGDTRALDDSWKVKVDGRGEKYYVKKDAHSGVTQSTKSPPIGVLRARPSIGDAKKAMPDHGEGSVIHNFLTSIPRMPSDAEDRARKAGVQEPEDFLDLDEADLERFGFTVVQIRKIKKALR